MKFSIYQVDAFTGQLFGGNPAAVVPLEKWLPDETLQAIAAENNLSETAFFTKNSNGYHIRWFTPACEVDLCGHATVAAAHVLWQHLEYTGHEISFQSRSGLLGVRNTDGWYVLDFPTDRIEQVETPDIILQALDFTPLEVWAGREDYLVLVENRKMVESASPDFKTLSRLKSRGIIITSEGEEEDFVSRCFFPAFGIDEDPVTGSAHTTLTPFWARRLNKTDLIARQISKRGGYLKCRHEGERTLISGQAVTYLEGKIQIQQDLT